MDIYQSTRGAVIKNVIPRAVPSGISIDGIGPFDYALVTGLSIQLSEKTSVIQCFNEKNYVYAFGRDPDASVVNVTFTGFLNGGCKSYTPSDIIGQALGAYDAKRAVNAVFVSVQLEGSTIEGILVGFQLNEQEVEINSVSFTFQVMVV